MLIITFPLLARYVRKFQNLFLRSVIITFGSHCYQFLYPKSYNADRVRTGEGRLRSIN